MHPEVVVIAALASHNRLIGRGLGLPWPPLREDLKRFKQLTRGHVLIVGRTTFSSIIHQFGRPLPERRMIVLTSRGTLPDFPDIETFASLRQAIAAAKDADKIFIAGGTRPYDEALGLADRLELTLIDGKYEGDTYFPPYRQRVRSEYELTREVPGNGFRFLTYRRRVCD